MKRTLLLTVVAASTLYILSFSTSLKAQFPSNLQNVTLNASLTESLTVTVTGGSTVNFNLVAGTAAPGDIPVTIQTVWVLRPNRAAVSLVGYFDTPASALRDAGPPVADIAAANVKGRVGTGTPTSFTAFTQNAIGGVGTAGASLELFTESVLGNNKNKTRTDNLDLEIDLTGTDQPAGTYTGILHIQAVAI